jgi:hypothetical protein
MGVWAATAAIVSPSPQERGSDTRRIRADPARRVCWAAAGTGAGLDGSVVVLVLSFRLTPIPRQPSIKIDLFGVVLSAAAIALILFGVNNLQTWGPLVAEAAAPFSLLRLSPAPIFILVSPRSS